MLEMFSVFDLRGGYMGVKTVIVTHSRLVYFLLFVLCILYFNFKTTIQTAITAPGRKESVQKPKANRRAGINDTHRRTVWLNTCILSVAGCCVFSK